ncbi:MAG: EAL domain-containing protein [Gammaproteobacteria bacterium]
MQRDESSEAQVTIPAPQATDAPREDREAFEREAQSAFPIVGIGASAGGLEAFTQLLGHLPDQTGMAFVLVQHLDPRHESRLTDLLSRATRMPVVEATQGLEVRPDSVYIIPPNTNMAIAQGALQITPRGEGHAHLPIDHFLRALAQAQPAQAIGVVLSGTGSDGTLGLSEIKAGGGISFAQAPESARHGGMPQSAIDARAVDFVLPPENIAERLAAIGPHPYLATCHPEEPPEAEDQFKRILGAVRSATGVDFSLYRDATIRRRIMRRMALHGEPSLAAYTERLETDGGEVKALYRDFLINVTSFFRDPDLFETLKESVFPEIWKNKSPATPIRIWVPGCSTGQEAYSLAIALWEFFDDKPVHPSIRIFATDLSDAQALERARTGLYPESIEAEVSPERLRRFFRKEDHLYRIDKSIREACVFGRQNVTADPPFSHVDLISCRNVLIYMAPALQKRVLPIFHYALNVPGFLVLGSAETVSGLTGLFEVAEKAHKIYGKKVAGNRPLLHFKVENHKTMAAAGYRCGPPGAAPTDFQKEADRVLLGRYAPPGVLLNKYFDILQFRGNTSPYLEIPPGEPTSNLLKMARQGLFLELRSALTEAKEHHQAARREGMRVRDEQGARVVTIEVLPVQPRGVAASCYLVLFEETGAAGALERSSVPMASAGEPAEAPPAGWLGHWLHALRGAATLPAPPSGREEAPASEPEHATLRQELAATREYLQALMAQQHAADEELRSANKEILSSDEELQSTNEELETAKEELQSSNEELSTANEQFQHRNLELIQTTNDLNNLLTSTTIPVLLVGPDLRIRHLTPPASKIMNLLPTDFSRPIGDLKANVDVPDLEALIGEVIDHVQVREREVCDRDGRWYALRVHPYRTSDNEIDGAVVVLLDIDEIKRSQEALRQSAEWLSLAVQLTGMATWDVDLKIGKALWSDTHFTILGYDPMRGGEASLEMWQSRLHPDDRERVLRAVEQARSERSLYAPEHRIIRADNGEERWLSVFGRFSYDEAGEAKRFLGVMYDVTDSRKAEKLSYQATHDPLTGLINRGEFERRLQRVLGTAEARDPHALLYLDLDQFKLVNDTAGHMAGDELLHQLAAVLETKTRKRDTLARLGGDEFGVLLEHCAPEQALRIARGLVQTVQEFDFVWEAKRFTLGVSIGLVSIPEGGETLPEVLSAADRACYAAKDKGRNRVHVYTASDEELAQRKGEMQWIPRLHRALAENRFRLYAQPIRALGDHGAAGEYQEVLLRLADDEKGVLLPGAFIPAAERYQQMQALDRWVVQTALAKLGAHGDSARLAINVSGQSLGDAGFLDYVTEQLEGSGAGPAQVCFEITETAVITDLKHALNFMHALKQRGCRFALDDFGSGLSSFGYLKALPVDYLKIDGRFVRDITEDCFDLAIVQAIQQVAQVLGIKTIAESVETEPILERLRAIGVDYAQGYAIATPQPLQMSSPIGTSS